MVFGMLFLSVSKLPFELIFEDSALLVFNKPSGLLSVPGKGPEKADCLRTRVQQIYPEALTVHRLDMSTSGVLLMARSAELHRKLSIAFQNREVKKRYIAVVEGHVLENSSLEWQLIDKPIATDWINRPLQKIDMIEGKASQTHYKILSYDIANNTTRLELAPTTGRTHQLRVHLQSLGHSILGDHLYALPDIQAKSNRLLLHASSLTITHPISQAEIEWRAETPF
jgi:tRNA pseudouridine32 synthase / 23S rRNA pseudouridine746 synthase